MPVMDGYTTARALREDRDPALAATPIIVSSRTRAGVVVASAA
jgi:CheY-like chemotaxis protein